MHQFLLATRNSHKTREFAEILGDGFDVHDLADVDLPVVEESGLTFEANAILKAVETSKHFQELVVADDSGLEVDALAGAPGIYSARYAGENASDAANVAKLLAELAECDPGLPSARFRCSLALARQGEILEIFEGVIEGTIAGAPRGSAGFGYDPVFQPEGFEQTFGELSAAEKNRISHRARAIWLLRTALLAKS
jgi:non-canonical purine NTP pyrophosphatase (RdgB/HAM1 family)